MQQIYRKTPIPKCDFKLFNMKNSGRIVAGSFSYILLQNASPETSVWVLDTLQERLLFCKVFLFIWLNILFDILSGLAE